MVHIDETVRFRRCWSHELAAELAGEHGSDFLGVVGPDVLCYEFRPSTSPSKLASPGATLPLVLTFQLEASARGGGSRFSAEAFEALLFLALCTRRPASGTASRSKPLANTFDPANPAPFVASMAAHVGPLQGMPMAAAASARRKKGAAADEDFLTTPMRGLDIS